MCLFQERLLLRDILYLTIQKQPSCEKSVQRQNARVKKDGKSKMVAKKWL